MLASPHSFVINNQQVCEQSQECQVIIYEQILSFTVQRWCEKLKKNIYLLFLKSTRKFFMFMVEKSVSQQCVLHDFFLQIYSTLWLNIWFGDHLVQMIRNAILKIRSFLEKMHLLLFSRINYHYHSRVYMKSWNIQKHSSKFTVHRIEMKYLRFCWIESQQLHHICVCARINLKKK